MAAAQKVLVVSLNDKPEYQRILEGQPQTHGMRSGRVHLKCGEACGQHSTKHHEELLVFLTGQGELLIADKDRFEVGAGKAVYIPPQTLHDVHNTGSTALTYIYCVAPAGDEKESPEGSHHTAH
jgi:mannose-6-phosphate isomerase-like protein (cupin superfamily)